MTSTSKTKPCHTCRRRRLRCDRSWPTCNKCAFTGQECLGYGKVFVWAQSNSNPQGSSRPWPISRTSSAEPNSFQIEGPAGLMLTGSPRAREMDERLSKPAIEPSGENGAMALTISIHDEHEENSTLRRHSLSRAGKIAWARVNKALDHAIAAPSEDMPDKAKSPHLPHRPYAGAVMLLNGLTDPVLQDLNPTSRYYLSHCECSRKTTSPSFHRWQGAAKRRSNVTWHYNGRNSIQRRTMSPMYLSTPPSFYVHLPQARPDFSFHLSGVFFYLLSFFFNVL